MYAFRLIAGVLWYYYTVQCITHIQYCIGYYGQILCSVQKYCILIVI
jgi:hypothetical protein